MTPKQALREIDLPPMWLSLFAGAVWIVGWIFPLPIPFAHLLGNALIGVGLTLTMAAAAQMVWRRTTFVPRRKPGRLVTTGVFAISRNPIYLADALILAGLVLLWDAVLAAPLVPVFMVFITQHFIRGEEVTIGTLFGADYAAYRARVRRWL